VGPRRHNTLYIRVSFGRQAEQGNMSRRSTTIWIVGAVVVVGAGITIAAVSLAHAPNQASAGATSTPRTTSSSTPRPTASGTPGASDQDPSGASTTPVTTNPQPSSTASPPVTVKKVVPSMSYYAYNSGTLTLGGGVSGLVENGGTCTVSVWQGASTVTQKFAAKAGPSSTDCGAMSISSTKFTSGTWNLTITYSSPDAQGTSPATQVSL
jgi:cytoskeletal protein RodZ